MEPGDPILPLTRTPAAGEELFGAIPSGLMDDNANIMWTEFPSTDGSKNPRYNTCGLFGNDQTSLGMVAFEGAYNPSRQFYKNLFGLPVRTQAEVDAAHEIRLDQYLGGK